MNSLQKKLCLLFRFCFTRPKYEILDEYRTPMLIVEGMCL